MLLETPIPKVEEPIQHQIESVARGTEPLSVTASLAGIDTESGHYRTLAEADRHTSAAGQLVNEARAEPTSEELARLGSAFESWRRKLLDLSGRNRALRFTSQRVATISFEDDQPIAVYRKLVGEEEKFRFVAGLRNKLPKDIVGEFELNDVKPARTYGNDSDESHPDQARMPETYSVSYEGTDTGTGNENIFRCRKTPEDLDRSLRRISELQRTSLEEQGINTIYLALGFLYYQEAIQADETYKAPLVLVPIVLDRKGARSEFTLKMGDDEPLLNPTLVEYLRRDHEIELPQLPEVSDDASSLDLGPFFATIRDRVAGSPGWHVKDEMALSPLSFQKLVMYRDLEQSAELFAKHPILRQLVLRKDSPQMGLPPDIAQMSLDDDFPPEATLTVVDADSSQLRAIAAVDRWHNLVIHGPPGTGKSQTITNLIAQSLGVGKSVLFVSEKMAALEVVASRLKSVGLSPFCLELHSVKTNKGQVLQSIQQAADASQQPARGTVKHGQMLARVRNQLTDYAHTLHRPRTALECAPFRAIGRFAEASSAPRVSYDGDPRLMTPQELERLELLLKQADATGKAMGEVNAHGWRDSALMLLTEDSRDTILATASQIVVLTGRLTTHAQDIACTYGLPIATRTQEIREYAAIASHIAASPGWNIEALRSASPTQTLLGLRELVTEGRRLEKLRSRFQTRYNLDVLGDIDLAEVSYIEQKAVGLFGWAHIRIDGRCRSIKRRWHAARQPGFTGSILDQVADLKRIPGWRVSRKSLDSSELGIRLFEDAWLGADSKWNDLEARINWLDRFFELRATADIGDAGYALATQRGAPDVRTASLLADANTLDSSANMLSTRIEWPDGYLSQLDFAATGYRANEVLLDAERASAWVAFIAATYRIRNTPASPMAAAALTGTISSNAMSASFQRALFGRWLELIIPDDPELLAFNQATHDTTRHEFQKLDEGLLTELQRRVGEQVRVRSQSRFASAPASHRQFLQRQLAKQRRHGPLRVTLREAYEAVRAVKPCFLMSPLTVAQFLPPTAQFDIVIFDEASQLPTEDAIGAIARGIQLVVVGDPKQLPPSDFFSVAGGSTIAVLDDDGEPVVQDTESILEECLGAGLHQQHLKWHYRSAHEQLIQFSNEMFYDNSLIVFPAADYDGPELGVKFEYLPDGEYAGAGLNPIEARKVAEAVAEHFRSRPDESLGVGTFNSRQQNAILDELEKIRRAHPDLEEFFSRERNEPFFVKNLENIQGDERDVIFLSVTYGRQSDGVLRYNFGPLNRETGWRRMNVLVSRAKKRMRVFSSLRASDIDPAKTATRGPALLRDFLHFAETGNIQRIDSSSAETESPFESHVMQVLQEHGYLVDAQVGVGPYRIDLGVRHPNRPGVFLAGIECDGASYHSAPCARDRDRLRQQVLERRGWTIVRIWSTDWFKDRQGTTTRVLRTLADLSLGLEEPK